MRSDFDRDLRLTASQLQNHLAPDYDSARRHQLDRQIAERRRVRWRGDQAPGRLWRIPSCRPEGGRASGRRGRGVHEVGGYRVTSVPLRRRRSGDRVHRVRASRGRISTTRSAACASSSSSVCSAAPRWRCSPASPWLGARCRPVARLTTAAKEIARTRDPGVSLPKPEADDEVADLARTLERDACGAGRRAGRERGGARPPA